MGLDCIFHYIFTYMKSLYNLYILDVSYVIIVDYAVCVNLMFKNFNEYANLSRFAY